MGARSGFQAQLKRDLPHVFVLGCICHSLALSASAASHKLPSWLEAWIKDVCGYFSRSSKRQHEFHLIQEALQSPRHKILKLSQTRWLSRGAVIARIIEQWDALMLFFQCQSPVDKIDGAHQIYKTMTTSGTKHMMLFLNYIVPKIDTLNLEFQSESFRLHRVFASIRDGYREILSMFVREGVMESADLAEIDPTNTANFKTWQEVNVGG